MLKLYVYTGSSHFYQTIGDSVLILLLIINIDSPHSSFEHNNIPPNSLPRESIEVRVIVFSENPSGA